MREATMPDEQTGKPGDSTALEPQTEPGSAPVEGTNEDGELILGKFKSDEDVRTGYKNLESEASKMAQERAALKRQIQDYEEKTQFSEVLTQVSERITPKDEPKPLDFEKFCTDHADEWDGHSGIMARDLAAAMGSWQEADTKAVNARMAAMETASGEKMSALETRVIKQSQEYTENRDAVEALMAEGITLDRAIVLATKFRAPDSELATRLRPAASITSTVVPETTVAKDEFYFADDAEEADYIQRHGIMVVKDMATSGGKKLRGTYA